ncbi:MAG: PLP-dependent transferase, partial [Alphaproteobacteria bacterium]
GTKLVAEVQLHSHVANVGDTRSLIIHPASTTHRQLTDDQKVQAGAGPDVVRLSVGIEDAADIIADLEAALSAI